MATDSPQLAEANDLLEKVWKAHEAGDGCLDGDLEVALLQYQERYGMAWWLKGWPQGETDAD